MIDGEEQSEGQRQDESEQAQEIRDRAINNLLAICKQDPKSWDPVSTGSDEELGSFTEASFGDDTGPLWGFIDTPMTQESEDAEKTPDWLDYSSRVQVHTEPFREEGGESFVAIKTNGHWRITVKHGDIEKPASEKELVNFLQFLGREEDK